MKEIIIPLCCTKKNYLMIKRNLICFDIDGVLLDEEYWFSKRWENTFSKFDISQNCIKEFWIIFKNKGFTYKKHLDELSINHPSIIKYKKEIIKTFKETKIQEKKIGNIVELLDCCSKNNYLSIISNGNYSVQYDRLKRSGILDYFDLIICDEIFKKPSSVSYEMTKFYYNTQELFYVGNEYESDFIGAKAVNFKTIFYNVENQKYSKNLVDFSISNLLDIKNIINLQNV